MLRAATLDSRDWIESIGEAWHDLYAASSSATPFQSPGWIDAWSKTLGRNRRPRVFACYEGDDLVALLPMAFRGGAWRTLRTMAAGPSDYLHPLVRDGYEEMVAQAFEDWLTEQDDVDLIDLPQVRETLAFRLVGVEAKAQALCLVLDLPSTYDQYLAGLSKSLRYDCRRLERPPFSDGNAALKVLAPDEIEQGLAAFFDLHSQRWRRRGLPGAFALRALREFHSMAAKNLAARDTLRLTILRDEGGAVGALYALKSPSTTYFYQSGFDPAAKALSPGTLLVADAIRRAIEEGCSQFDFLRGDEPYKRRWKPQREYQNLRWLKPLGGLRGQIGQAWNDASGRVETRIRERLEGRGLTA